jgi:hypothetical protein
MRPRTPGLMAADSTLVTAVVLTKAELWLQSAEAYPAA